MLLPGSLPAFWYGEEPGYEASYYIQVNCIQFCHSVNAHRVPAILHLFYYHSAKHKQ